MVRKREAQENYEARDIPVSPASETRSVKPILKDMKSQVGKKRKVGYL
jgi:hypothetical protein